ncbi:MAG: LysM peptidoglycan-binding domain-containing protein [Candidatus Pacebacteria bacterium]|nr:LysM peptidoglycan-binding domain-containing protein [Candidatus Paceibacterota bacterium]
MSQASLKKTLKKAKLNEKLINQTLGVLALVVVGILIFNYFKAPKSESTLEPVISEISQEQNEVVLIEEDGKLVPETLPEKYLVVTGDSLWKIAEKFYSSGYNWVDIAKANNLTDADQISPGKELNLPKAEVRQPIAGAVLEEEFGPAISEDSYLVQKGDSLWKIAVRAYGDGYRWAEIAQANQLEYPGLIHPGNKLAIPR